MCTEEGVIKKTTLEAYSRPRQGGINAITLREGGRLLDVVFTTGNSEIVIAKKSGKAIRFNESTVRPMGRTATGVKAVTLEDENDQVVGMVAIDNPETENLLVVSEKGYGKRSDLEEYRITNRGGKGVKTLQVTDKTGALVALKKVTDADDLLIINKSGITLRMSVANLRVIGRATQGVRLIKLNENDEISSVAVMPMREDEVDDSIETVVPEPVE
jgi:DNA gyrase subunit A